MKRLQPPQINDTQIIQELASNQLLHRTSYPHLQNQLADILNAYDEYTLHNGNPWSVVQPSITEHLKVGLRSHYTSPPTSLKYLSKLRKSSPDVCPMCGGFHPTTLDHYLPKTVYPVWSIFSKNLIPACGCNTARGDVVKAPNRPSVRVLHPYFDDFIRDRVLTTEITHSHDFKWLKAKVVCTDLNHPEVESINFHIENVINRNGFDNWQRGKLSKLVERPCSVVTQLPVRRHITKQDLITDLQDCIDNHDYACGTPNNWYSMLIHGILCSVTLHDWLIFRHNDFVDNH